MKPRITVLTLGVDNLEKSLYCAVWYYPGIGGRRLLYPEPRPDCAAWPGFRSGPRRGPRLQGQGVGRDLSGSHSPCVCERVVGRWFVRPGGRSMAGA